MYKKIVFLHYFSDNGNNLIVKRRGMPRHNP